MTQEDLYEKAYEVICKRIDAIGIFVADNKAVYAILNEEANIPSSYKEELKKTYLWRPMVKPSFLYHRKPIETRKDLLDYLFNAAKHSDIEVFLNDKVAIQKGETLENLLVEADLMI